MLPQQRATAARLLGLTLPDQWPQADLYNVLPLQTAAELDEEPFGVWLIVERVEWALSQPKVRAVSAACSSDNAASIRVLERLGFARTGEENGQLLWRLDAGV